MSDKDRDTARRASPPRVPNRLSRENKYLHPPPLPVPHQYGESDDLYPPRKYERHTRHNRSDDMPSPCDDRNSDNLLPFCRCGSHSQGSRRADPFARYEDDGEMNCMLWDKQVLREDPMFDYFQERQRNKDLEEDKVREPVHRGDYPPNRFDIPPGHRWDGVDRSNRFEARWLMKQSERKVREGEAPSQVLELYGS